MIGLLSLLAAPAWGQSPSSLCEDDDGPAPVCEDRGDRLYLHPLSTGVWSAGQVPLLDVLDNPAGHRYAFVDGATGVAGRTTRQRTVAALARAQLRPPATPAPTEAEPAMIRTNLAEALRTARPTDVLPMIVHVHATPPPSLQDELSRALATGVISTIGERDALRRSLLTRRKQDNGAVLAPLVGPVEAAGVQVQHLCPRTPCMRVVGPASSVAQLQALPFVRAVGLLDASESHADAIGSSAARHTQAQQFFDDAYTEGGKTYHPDGENGIGVDLTAAIMERDGFSLSHQSFLDYPHPSHSRIRQGRQCDNASCTTITQSWPGTVESRLHGTAMLGLYLGDLTDAQIPGLNVNYAAARSFASREARAYAYQFRDEGLDVAYDDVLERAVFPQLASHSNGFLDDKCDATHFSSEEVCESLYQSGVAVFGSAGNAGGGPQDCTARTIGGALCSVAVAGYDPLEGFDGGVTDCAWRSAIPHSESSWGGSCNASNTAEGYCRTIIDLATPQCMRFMPDGPTSDTAFLAESKCGTSVSTAYAAGLATNFVDAYKHFFSDFIDDPGLLKTWMLQMGDYGDGRFDNRLGGGRAKMRLPSEAGLDAPWAFWSVETCLKDGERVAVAINDRVLHDGVVDPVRLSPEMDDITVTAWFYDREFQTTPRSKKPRVDHVLLMVRDLDTNTLVGWDNSADEKKRIRLSGVGGRRLAVEAVGVDVSNDHLGCGQDGLRLYMAILAEDDARDDPEGPAWDEPTCRGVEPMTFQGP
jgi:hypothetical protein